MMRLPAATVVQVTSPGGNKAKGKMRSGGVTTETFPKAKEGRAIWVLLPR